MPSAHGRPMFLVRGPQIEFTAWVSDPGKLCWLWGPFSSSNTTIRRQRTVLEVRGMLWVFAAALSSGSTIIGDCEVRILPSKSTPRRSAGTTYAHLSPNLPAPIQEQPNMVALLDFHSPSSRINRSRRESRTVKRVSSLKIRDPRSMRVEVRTPPFSLRGLQLG